MAISNWNKGQLVVIWFALLLGTALIYGGYNAWEEQFESQQQNFDKHQKQLYENLRTLIQLNNGEIAPELKESMLAMDRASWENIQENFRYGRKRRIIRPLVFGIVFFVIPFILLLISWRWYSTKSSKNQNR